MSRMKKLLALLLVLALGLSLAACGSAKSDIIGTWQGRVDMTEYIVSKLDRAYEEAFASGDDGMELVSIRDYLGNFDPVYTYVFNEDGSYALTVDEASLHDQIEEFKTGLEAYSRYIFAELLSMTLVELGMAEQVNGMEELEAIMGVSLDEAISEIVGMELRDFIGQIVDEELGTAQKMAGKINVEGKYKAKDGKLWLSSGLEYDVNPELYDLYSVSGSTLTIEAGTVSQGEVALAFPLVLEKAT
ncbi:MAG: hypothetical protein ACI4O0_04035 [Candidatus Limivicinus sp.]